jgi:transposase-like protein
MAQQETMSLTEFFDKFDTEESCREYLYIKRWPDGFVCPKCGVHGEPFKIVSRNLYQCKHCTHQTSVTAGTIMDKSRTPLRKWFLAIYLMSSDKRGCSALRLKKELKIAYDTAWTISHKIRNAMKQRDEDYKLSGYVEMDEGFFGSPSEGEGKRGRGTDKAPVVVGLSLDEKGYPEFVKAKVLETVDSQAITDFAGGAVEEGSCIGSDGLSIYRKLAEKGYVHLPENFDSVNNPEHLKRLHIVISNLKAFINGTYHGVGKTHLQTFLDEFCYRFNRRFWPHQLFARTVAACVSASTFTRYDLIG